MSHVSIGVVGSVWFIYRQKDGAKKKKRKDGAALLFGALSREKQQN